MKILHLIYDSIDNPWLGGGGAVRAAQINKILISIGHEVTVCCGLHPKTKTKKICDGVRYNYIGSSRNYLLSRLLFSFKVRLFVKLHSKDYDIVIDDISAFTFVNPFALTTKPIVGIMHHFIAENAQGKYGAFGKIAEHWETYKVKKHKNLITVSNGVMDKCRALNSINANVIMIPAGVQKEYFSKQESAKDFLLYLGRIDIYNKGLDILLDAFKRVSPIFPNLKLIIAGGGKDSVILMKLVSEHEFSDRIEIKGFVSENLKIQLLRECFLLCMPSRFEGWGMVAMEAAATSTLVVGTNISGLNEAVLNNKTGILSSLNSASYADAIIMALDNEELRKNLVKNAYKRSLEFSWSEVTKETEAFYLKAIQTRS